MRLATWQSSHRDGALSHFWRSHRSTRSGVRPAVPLDLLGNAIMDDAASESGVLDVCHFLAGRAYLRSRMGSRDSEGRGTVIPETTTSILSDTAAVLQKVRGAALLEALESSVRDRQRWRSAKDYAKAQTADAHARIV